MSYVTGDRVEIRNHKQPHFNGQTGTVLNYRGGEYYSVKPDYAERNIFLHSEMRPEPWRAHRVERHYGLVTLTQTARNFMASSSAYMALAAQDLETVHYWQERAVRDGIVYG